MENFMKKGLIAVQYWEGDKKKAMHLAKLIADIEPVHRDDVDFVFIARADCEHDQETVNHVLRKFNVRKLKCMARATGHPWGCWVLWFSLMEWFYHMRAANKLPSYDWVFPFEADCVPMTKTWINDLHEEFTRHQSMLVGAEWLQGYHHLNGNMMVSADMQFIKWLVMGVTMGGVPRQEPWDVYLFPKFSQWGVGFSDKFLNAYATRTLSQEEYEKLQQRGLVWLHGVKDDSAAHWARESLVKNH